jgi:hypothetical protein
LGGDDDGDDGGGADIDLRDFCVDALGALLRGGFGLEVGDRTGEEDSAPDWKMLLSSQPLSSASWIFTVNDTPMMCEDVLTDMRRA